jgi:hypothetical protein
MMPASEKECVGIQKFCILVKHIQCFSDGCVVAYKGKKDESREIPLREKCNNVKKKMEEKTDSKIWVAFMGNVFAIYFLWN